MNGVRLNSRERLQNKAPRVHGGMRDRQTSRVYDRVPEEHDVDIDGSWAFYLCALTSHRLLEFEDARKKLLRRELRFQSDNTIQKERLMLYFNRFRFIE